MPFGGLLSIGVGTAMGAGKYAAAKNRADKDRKLSAEQIRLSPYTGRTTFQSIQEPNIFEDLSSGVSSGALLGKQFGAFNKTPGEVDVTGSTSGGYDNANLGVDKNLGSYDMPDSLKQPTMPMTSLASGAGNTGNPDYPYRRFMTMKHGRDEGMFR